MSGGGGGVLGDVPPPLPGRWVVIVLDRWLSPPANVRQACGLGVDAEMVIVDCVVGIGTSFGNSWIVRGVAAPAGAVGYYNVRPVADASG